MAALSTPSPSSASDSGTADPPEVGGGGRVSRLRQNWAVHEDGALAERLQSQEFEAHLSGNKQRNHQIRSDFPEAVAAQTREELQAERIYREHQRQVQQQEDRDAEIARRMALEWERKEREHRAYEATRDEIFARRIQNLEAHPRGSGSQPSRTRTQPPPPCQTPPLPVAANGDVPYARSAGSARGGAEASPPLDPYLVKVARPAWVTPEPVYANNQPEHYAVSGPFPSADDEGSPVAGGAAGGPRAGSLSPELLEAAGLSQRDLAWSRKAEERLDQERRDRELARRLQEQLSSEADEDASEEAQRLFRDQEYARKLELKEQDKLRRAKERSRLKKLEQRQQQQLAGADLILSDPRGPSRLSKSSGGQSDSQLDESHVSLPMRRPWLNPAAIDEYASGSQSEPQYANVGAPTPNPGPAETPIRPGTTAQLLPDQPVPPYMPMQQSQSRKSSSLEKRILKKKEKEGCKQQ